MKQCIIENTSTDNSEVIRLCPEELRIGDVVLSTDRKSPVSWLIRTVTGSSISHVALHIGAGFLIEAVAEGVRRVHCRRFIYSNQKDIRVLRPTARDEDKLNAATKYAKALVYRPYAYAKAITSVMPIHIMQDTGRFCSELVYEALSTKGVLSSKHRPTNVTPANFLEFDEFDDVTDEVSRSLTGFSLEQAITSFRSRLVATGRERQLIWRAEHLEKDCLAVASKVMAQHSVFTPPYHLIDVLRQMSLLWDNHEQLVREVDKALVPLLEDAKVDKGDVRPREVIPGMTTVAVNPDLVLPFWDAGESVADAIEFKLLGEDLANSKELDLVELAKGVNEIRLEANRTGLASFRLTHTWLLWDEWYAKANYYIFDRLADAVLI